MPLGYAVLVLTALTSTLSAQAPAVRLVRFSDAKIFHMGSVTAMRLVTPDTGAKHLTLNYSLSQLGSEFAQHVHDHSDDTILVLRGAADLRQGGTRTPMRQGVCAFVPAGQIHGTITTAPDTVMISTQTPPDLILYTGARDSSKPGAPPPQGVITPGAVKFLPFADRKGFFVDSAIGARRVAVARRTLSKGESLKTTMANDTEQLLFVWNGAIAAKAGAQTYQAGEKDTIFATGPGIVEITGASEQPATIIQIQSPPGARL
jgi:quercetin dioxygenase-like cupin family protein